jgi:hypothetical protein
LRRFSAGYSKNGQCQFAEAFDGLVDHRVDHLRLGSVACESHAFALLVPYFLGSLGGEGFVGIVQNNPGTLASQLFRYFKPYALSGTGYYGDLVIKKVTTHCNAGF